jgi:hypothetical protein
MLARAVDNLVHAEESSNQGVWVVR